MKCPECGYEIADDHLYCDRCGKEIQIVPDFEPEIENSIIETLSTVAEQIDGTNASADSGGKVNEKENKGQEDTSAKEKHKEVFWAEEPAKNWLFISLVTFIVITIVAAFTAVFMYHRYSAAYQVEQAKACAADGNFEKAVDFLEKARTLDEEPADIVLLEAGYLYQMGESERALEILLELIDKVQMDYEKKEKAYENIIAIYSEEERFKEMKLLLISFIYKVNKRNLKRLFRFWPPTHMKASEINFSNIWHFHRNLDMPPEPMMKLCHSS